MSLYTPSQRPSLKKHECFSGEFLGLCRFHFRYLQREGQKLQYLWNEKWSRLRDYYGEISTSNLGFYKGNGKWKKIRYEVTLFRLKTRREVDVNAIISIEKSTTEFCEALLMGHSSKMNDKHFIWQLNEIFYVCFRLGFTDITLDVIITWMPVGKKQLQIRW